MERASLHVTRSSLFNFVGERKRNDQNSTSILVISVFLPRFNALPITITIESARFLETTLSVFATLHFITSTNHGLREKGAR